MSTSRDPNDQANQLREKMKAELHPEASSKDISTLPPRSEVHKTKDQTKKTKVKLKYPLVRVLAVLFVLLPIAILAFTLHQSYQNEKNDEVPSKKEESISKEEISLDIHTDDLKKTYPPIEDNEEVMSVEESKREETTDSYRVVLHTVKADETLYTISQHYYQSRDGEKLIIEWNELVTNQVEVGQVLKIPLK